MMHRSLLLVAILGMAFYSQAQELPQLSPAATVSQRIGLTDVTVTYSRPSARGREVFGGLVPYGEMWRTGANHSTIIEFSDVVTIMDQSLPAGKYSLFTIPNSGAWEVIFNRNTTLSGLDGYITEEDVLRVKTVVRPCNNTESFAIQFENLGEDRADLVLRWAKQEVALTIEAGSTKKAVQNIQEALQKPDADYIAYARSAGFYLDRGIEPAKALEWARKSVDMEKKYWNTFYLARALAATGDKEAAVKKGEEAVDLATAAADMGAVRSYQARIAEWQGPSKGK